MSFKKRISRYSGPALFITIITLWSFMVLESVAVDISSQVVVGNAAPTVTNVKILNDSAITLTANATTAVTVSFTVTDNNNCTDVFEQGTVSGTIFRSDVAVYTGDVIDCAADNQNCYRVSTTTEQNCTSGNVSGDATATFEIYYFAQGTDASSSYSTSSWQSYIIVVDQPAASGSASSSDQELNSLTSVTSASTTIDYGTIAASSTTGSTRQEIPMENVGNTTSGAAISGSAMTNANDATMEISTGSQRYATSGTDIYIDDFQLQETATDLANATSTPPTSTEAVLVSTFWGLEVLAGRSTGTYAGTSTFDGVYGP